MGICISKGNTNIYSNKNGDISNTSKKKHSAENKLNDDVSKKIIKYIDLNQSQKNQVDDLLKGIQSNDISRLTPLKKNRINVNVTYEFGITPLDIAVYNGNADIVKALVIAGADVNVTDKYGNTPLMKASRQGNLEIFEVLVNAGEDIVQLLLDSGAKVNVTNVIEETPLHIASKEGNLEIVKALVNAGAELNTTDIFGKTALQMAKRYGRDDNVNKAIEAGKKELIAQLDALEHDHMWGEKSRGKLAALCNKQSQENNHNRGDVLNNPDLQRYIWGFNNKNNKPSLRLKKARQYSAEAKAIQYIEELAAKRGHIEALNALIEISYRVLETNGRLVSESADNT